MLAFELFDENGKLNPRKVLFSAQTSPSRANSLLTTLFGGIMKWNARRWAENYLHDAMSAQLGLTSETSEEIQKLITNIKASKAVNSKDFYSLAADIESARKNKSTALDDNPKGQVWAFFSHTRKIINSDALIKNKLLETAARPATETKSEQKIKTGEEEEIKHRLSNDEPEIEHQSPDNTTVSPGATPQKKLKEAHEVISDLWKELSAIHGGELAPPLIKDAAQSGFLEYCKTQRLPDRAADRDCLESFLRTSSEQWQQYSKVLTKDQYQQFTEHRNQALKKITLPQEPEDTENSGKKIDQRHALNAQAESAPSYLTTPAHEAIYDKWREFEELSRGKLQPPRLLALAVESGFILYCRLGYPSLVDADMELLEEFAKLPAKEWINYKKILTEEQFKELEKNRVRLIQDLSRFRPSEERTMYRNESIQTETRSHKTSPGSASDILPSEDKNLFSENIPLTEEALSHIRWDPGTLYQRIQSEDAERIARYFASAPPSEKNRDVARKVITYTKNLEQMLSDDSPDLEEEQTKRLGIINTTLARAAMAFIVRYNLYVENLEKSSHDSTSSASSLKPNDEFHRELYDQLDQTKKFIEARLGDRSDSSITRKKSGNNDQ